MQLYFCGVIRPPSRGAFRHLPNKPPGRLYDGFTPAWPEASERGSKSRAPKEVPPSVTPAQIIHFWSIPANLRGRIKRELQWVLGKTFMHYDPDYGYGKTVGFGVSKAPVEVRYDAVMRMLTLKTAGGPGQVQ